MAGRSILCCGSDQIDDAVLCSFHLNINFLPHFVTEHG